MNDKLFELLSQTVSKSGIQKNTEELNRLEGNESNSNFKASTDFLLKVMQESGFEQVERIPLPADGIFRLCHAPGMGRLRTFLHPAGR